MRTRRSRSSGNSAPPVASVTTGAYGHTPVLLHETLEALNIRTDDIVVDATLGGAGHARAICEKLGKAGVFIGFDMDADAIARARIALQGATAQLHLLQRNFRTLGVALEDAGIPAITKALFDLGWSSYQLDAGRGFSFSAQGRPALGGPDRLLMTYSKDPTPDALTAHTIVNDWAESSLADVIYGWGQERYARRIAKAIVVARTNGEIRTAKQLADIIARAVPARARYGRIHPATKTFQALRIAVNDELGALEEGLRAAWERLRIGGRIAVISFHSLEDAAVKRAFVAWEKKEQGRRITKKPITPTEEELQVNRRARSAKLRVIEKIATLQSYGQENLQNKQI